jgi:uncharacterized membrane protein YcjF (UPF0283 family)
MLKKRPHPTLQDCEDLADQVAERVVEAQREARRKSRRRFWSRLGYLLMLIGAASGLLTLLVALWEQLG